MVSTNGIERMGFRTCKKKKKLKKERGRCKLLRKGMCALKENEE